VIGTIPDAPASDSSIPVDKIATVGVRERANVLQQLGLVLLGLPAEIALEIHVADSGHPSWQRARRTAWSTFPSFAGSIFPSKSTGGLSPYCHGVGVEFVMLSFQ
jgi:hypothetical protein